jgi:LysM repeat protein
MFTKRFLQLFALIAILAASLGTTSSALAWGCSSPYIVQWGDSLSVIAQRCGITVYDLQAANPGVGYWIYAGQALIIPGSYQNPAPAPSYPSYGGTYVVQWGDTLRIIANRMGVSVNDILAVNPQIWNANWIYAGQVINLPATPSYYTVQRGDTLRIIANRFGTTVDSLLLLNPQIYNANWIYAGQVIRIW